MKHQPDVQDDFISSAGVPTIPLKTSKKRSFANTIVYAIIASIIVVVMVVGYELIYSVVFGFMTLYFGIGVVISLLFAIFGIIIKNKWMFLAGLVVTALGIGFVLSDISLGVSIAASLMIAVFVYRWYVATYHYESARWPLFVGVLALVFGVLLIIVQLQIIAAIIIAPVLLVLTGAMMIWELWRNAR